MIVSNISLQNGDTVVVNTNNPIDGLVSRPFNYEYLNSDTFLDLITYAGGFAKNANKERLSVDLLVENTLSTTYPSLNDIVNDKQLESIYVGRKTIQSKRDAMIIGSSVSNGSYGYKNGSPLSDLIGKLNFSNDIYLYVFTEQQWIEDLYEISADPQF